MSSAKRAVTYREAVQTIGELENQLMLAKAQLQLIPGSEFISAAHAEAGYFGDPVRCLINVLNDREYPMTADEIRQIFVANGYEFAESHVQECRPETWEQVDEYVSEMRRNA